MTTADVFTLLGNLCTIGQPLLPAPASTIVAFVGEAFKAGAAWSKAGTDPVVAITRHLDLDKLETDREAHWAAELEKRKAAESPAADPLKDPPVDPYEGG